MHTYVHVWVDGSKGSLQESSQPRLIYTLRLHTCMVLLLCLTHSPSLYLVATGTGS